MFYFGQNFGFFIGSLQENITHKHYALQVIVSFHSSLRLQVKGKDEILGQAFLINSKVEHQLQCEGLQITLLINPLSSIGHQLFLILDTSEFSILPDPITLLFQNLLKQYTTDLPQEEIAQSISDILREYSCLCENENHVQDDRIIKTLSLLEHHFDEILSLEAAAAFCHLSPPRFLHLFKEKTQLNFRRYQLWNKTIKSLPFLTHHSITHTAHAFGFTDSSHYTRTFKETFGFSPKFFVSKK